MSVSFLDWVEGIIFGLLIILEDGKVFVNNGFFHFDTAFRTDGVSDVAYASFAGGAYERHTKRRHVEFLATLRAKTTIEDIGSETSRAGKLIFFAWKRDEIGSVLAAQDFDGINDKLIIENDRAVSHKRILIASQLAMRVDINGGNIHGVPFVEGWGSRI